MDSFFLALSFLSAQFSWYFLKISFLWVQFSFDFLKISCFAHRKFSSDFHSPVILCQNTPFQSLPLICLLWSILKNTFRPDAHPALHLLSFEANVWVCSQRNQRLMWSIQRNWFDCAEEVREGVKNLFTESVRKGGRDVPPKSVNFFHYKQILGTSLIRKTHNL